MTIPTPHIGASNKNEIARTIIMPGDPLRAKFIAHSYLEDLVEFNSIRGMLGYTGTFKGKKLSVMGSGMGMPSMGIYSYELFKFYDVETIIRVGSGGSYNHEYKLYDIILAEDSYSESTYAKMLNGTTENILKSSIDINNKIITSAKNLDIAIKNSRIHTTDVFYRKNFKDFENIKNTYNCNIVEMEAFALFANAEELGKNAACLLTVSDSLVTHETTSAIERQNSFTQMLEIALNAAVI